MIEDIKIPSARETLLRLMKEAQDSGKEVTDMPEFETIFKAATAEQVEQFEHSQKVSVWCLTGKHRNDGRVIMLTNVGKFGVCMGCKCFYEVSDETCPPGCEHESHK